MGDALEITKQGYAAFGRRDIPALLKPVADEVDWQEAVPASVPYSGLRRNPAQVGEFFAAVDKPKILLSSTCDNSLRRTNTSRYLDTSKPPHAIRTKVSEPMGACPHSAARQNNPLAWIL
jgi:hypothetical protein